MVPVPPPPFGAAPDMYNIISNSLSEESEIGGYGPALSSDMHSLYGIRTR
jgi:hypothetical protein